MITQSEGARILLEAARSGEWTYSQGKPGDPPLDFGGNVGDCVDYCRSAVGKVVGRTSADRSTTAIRGGNHPGFVEVSAGEAQPGDMVVQGGHAGLYLGTSKAGHVYGLANNGSPHGSARGYRDSPTTVRDFRERSYGPGQPQFFRPLKP
jgi:hypothetical protein